MEVEQTHPNPQPNPHHRKIDLQSPADLLHLQRNLSLAATEKLNLHFPPKHAYATHIPLGPQPVSSAQTAENESAQADPMRQRVESLVTTFLRETWAGAKHGISVNGLDADGLPDHFTPAPAGGQVSSEKENEPEREVEGRHFTYAPYDPALGKQVANLYAELEGLTASVARLRRTNPRSGAECYIDELNTKVEGDEEEARRRQKETQLETGERDLLRIDADTEDAAQRYESGLAGLAGLSGLKAKSNSDRTQEVDDTRQAKRRKQDQQATNSCSSLTETVGKVQRARRVVEELE